MILLNTQSRRRRCGAVAILDALHDGGALELGERVAVQPDDVQVFPVSLGDLQQVVEGDEVVIALEDHELVVLGRCLDLVQQDVFMNAS